MTLRLVVCFLLFQTSVAFGQMADYLYKREISGVSDLWHSLLLPDEIFGHLNRDLSDIRVFGITTTGDTIEAPYVFTPKIKQDFIRQIDFRYINQSHDASGYYYTFEIPDTITINEIDLRLKAENFDWKIILEGSHDQKSWFTILEDYRILAFNNPETDFKYTTLQFPNSKYSFFKLKIKSSKNPHLEFARISLREKTVATMVNYKVATMRVDENKKYRQSDIYISLPMAVSANRLKLFIKDTIDFYRPVSISFISDSTLAQSGWIYHFTPVISGIATSTEEPMFDFKTTIAKDFKISITNRDNAPLTIDSVSVSGFEIGLNIRFAEKATYYLVYGNKNATKPHYDINRFIGNIPSHPKPIITGEEQTIEKADAQPTLPLFKTARWLWGILIVIVILLGWFSFRMITSKN